MATDTSAMGPPNATVTPLAPLERPQRAAWARVLNAVGRGLGRLGVRPRTLDADRLMAHAERHTGLADWGETDLREPLEVLCRALDAEAHLHPVGRSLVRADLLRLLANRLVIEDTWKRHPEIGVVPVRRPLVVAGMPRSGTTLLHRLLALEPSGRPLRYWEGLRPVPPSASDAPTADPRIARARRRVRLFDALAPEAVAGHEIEPDGPEECNDLLAHALQTPIFNFFTRVPGYRQWLDGQDLTGAYRVHRRLLQLLAWRSPTARWVLKAPAHTPYLDKLLRVYPDVSIVLLHRDPRAVVPSVCRLCAGFRRIYSDYLDPAEMGAAYTEALAVAFEKAMAVHAATGPGRILAVPYEAVRRDPVGTVRRIHAHFDLPYDPGTDARIGAWLARNPQHKHGVHRYSLEQFGLDAEAVRRRFAAYRAWAEAQADRDGATP